MELSSGSAQDRARRCLDFEGQTNNVRGPLAVPCGLTPWRRPSWGLASQPTGQPSPTQTTSPWRPAMALVGARQERVVRPRAHPEEWLSILFALCGALLAAAFF